MTTSADSQRSRAEWRVAVLMIVGAAALLALGTLAGMNIDEDELGTSVLMTVLQAQAVWHGHLPFWSSRLGFGLPQPGAESFFVHPLMPLFAWCDPYSASMALYATHIVLGALAFWWLCRTLKLSALTTGICTATFLLSSPSLQYTLTAFYPTYFVAWTLAPLVLGLLVHLLGDERPSPRVAVALGVVAGLMLADGHLGHAPFVLATLAAGAAAYPRRVRERLPWFAVALFVAVAIGSYHVGTTLDEYLRFPAGLPRWTDETLTAGGLWDLFLRPLTPELFRRLLDGRPEHVATFLLWRGTHVIFFGGPFALLAIAGVVSRRAAHRWRPLLALSAGLSILLIIVSSRWRLFPLSATYLLRDTVVIGGIGLAGITLDRIRESGTRRLMVHVIVGAQLIVMMASAAPFVARSLAADRVFRSRGSDAVMTAITSRLTASGAREGGRVYMTSAPTLWDKWGVDRPYLWLLRLTSAGVSTVNGLNKGIATEPLMPSYALPYGSVDGSPSLSRADASLNVLGIRSVIALDSEPVASSLTLVDSWPTPKGRLRLLDNPGAWPGAHFVRSGTVDRELPLLNGCPHTRLLCRDFTPVMTAAEEAVTAVQYGDGTITIRFAPVPRARTLLVTEMFREGWYALADGRRLSVTPAWDALMRVDVPAGVSGVELRYRPIWRMALAAVSWSAVVLSAFFALAAFRRSV